MQLVIFICVPGQQNKKRSIDRGPLPPVVVLTDTGELEYVCRELQKFDGCARRERQARLDASSPEYSNHTINRTYQAL